MYVDLEMFLQEQAVYKQKVNELLQSGFDNDILKIKLADEEVKYKNSIRKFLSAAINKINEVASGNFSLYKLGKDIDANFKVIESKVRKSKQELIEEFNEMMPLVNNLEEKNKRLVNIAIAVIIDYSDDIKQDSARESFLNK